MEKWLFAPLVGAAIAAIGYVAKIIINEIQQWRAASKERHGRLVTLQSLLTAAKRVFESQNDLIRKLAGEITAAHPDLQGMTYDDVLANGYSRMDERQKRTHGIIRSYTINAMRPLNFAMIDWLAADHDFKARRGTGSSHDLSSNLQTLEAHLILWRAKYEFSIPENAERALVYMEDEAAHGVGFPHGIDDSIARETGGPVRIKDA